MLKLIFITGGVISSVGKGILAASIGAILKNSVKNIKIRKFDPYLNIDSGTLDPYEHGEVFVTKDGTEVDLDIGHYERLSQIQFTKDDYCTTGQILQEIIKKERAGKYKGKTIQISPHLIDEIKTRFINNIEINSLVICEIGGTVGDIENTNFLHAAAQISQVIPSLFIHIGYIINLQHNIGSEIINNFWEDKTKPLQNSINLLYSNGIIPDIIACRGAKNPEYIVSKMQYLNSQSKIVCLPEENQKYLPYLYQQLKLGEMICDKLDLQYHHNDELQKINNQIQTYLHNQTEEINIGIVTKYLDKDAHKSLLEAIKHAAIFSNIKYKIHLIDAEKLNTEILKSLKGIIIPGGFGERGIDGKIAAIRYANKYQIPLLGICLGMQLMIITRMIDYVELIDATSAEFDLNNTSKNQIFKIRSGTERIEGKMLLGQQEIDVFSDTQLEKIYQSQKIFKRCRNRYEFNLKYKQFLTKGSLKITAIIQETVIAIEDPNSKFFIGVQYHPELSSSIISPEPLFIRFIKACSE